MSSNGWWQLALFLIVLLLLSIPMGAYMAAVFEGRSTAARVLGPIERGLYRLCHIDARAQMSWQEYALAMLLFNFLGTLLLYALQRAQAWLPWNPQHLSAVSSDSAFNTCLLYTSRPDWR